jgi:RsmE family RNA methyltransferase
VNLLLLADDDLRDRGATARIAGRRAAHLLDVLGVELGATVEAGLLGGRMGRATVAAIDGREILLRLDLDRDPPPRHDVRLVLALPRPKSLRRILQGCAAAGVRAVYLINSWRVEKSYWGSPSLASARIEEQLVLGAEQGRDTILPEVRLCRRFKPFVEDDLPGIASEAPEMQRLVGDARAPASCPAAVQQPVTLVIGPEGGLIPYELDMVAALGFTPVRVGARALRVEQAVAAFLGRLVP